MVNAEQFLIAQTPYTAEGWQQLPLQDGYILSFHRALAIERTKDEQFMLLGDAWQADPARPDPLAALEALCAAYPGGVPMQEVLNAEESWCGRYVLLQGSKVLLDAGGLKCVFYSQQGIASSAGILAGAMGLEKKIFEDSFTCQWLPGPLTLYPQIRRVLPSQIYDYRTGQLEARNLMGYRPLELPDAEARLQLFTTLFGTSLKNLVRRFPDSPVYIATTGGHDSRCVVANAWRAGIDFKCYTFEHDHMSIADSTTPQKIAAALEREHIWIPRDRSNYNADRMADYRLHTDGLANDKDRLYYAYDQYRPLYEGCQNKVLLLRGTLWEGSSEYWRKATGPVLDRQGLLDYFAAEKYPLVKQSLLAYFDWFDKSPQPYINDCDRLYMDVKAGSWCAPIEHGFDMVEEVMSVQPLNCRLLIRILQMFPRERRVTKTHEEDVANYACPILRTVPYGSTDPTDSNRFSRIKGKVKDGLIRLSAQGPASTVRTYQRIRRANAEMARFREASKGPWKE